MKKHILNLLLALLLFSCGLKDINSKLQGNNDTNRQMSSDNSQTQLNRETRSLGDNPPGTLLEKDYTNAKVPITSTEEKNTPVLTSSVEIKKETRPYNFTVTALEESNADNAIQIGSKKFGGKSVKHSLRIKEEGGCVEVDIEQGGGNVIVGSGFTVKKDKIDEFKRALLEGGNFECTHNSTKHTITVTISDDYSWFVYPGLTISYTIKLEDIGKYFILN